MVPDLANTEEPTTAALIVAQMRPALVKYFARKCRNTAEAEDLAQDVLLRALRHVRWESADQARGYIFRAAVNRWRDRGRMLLTHGVKVEWDAAAQELNEENSPEHVLIVEQELDRVAMALQELDKRTQEVLMLIRLENMKYAEVAEMLGVSVSTVEKELIKALAHLARRAGRKD
ncbi:MAG: sigma-70 family RNA polymerase sigma factor [Proteobacteria bacterium]|nr:sigma-70 family RNA polymerase sigma factor [Pseudomonadota bacterium]